MPIFIGAQDRVKQEVCREVVMILCHCSGQPSGIVFQCCCFYPWDVLFIKTSFHPHWKPKTVSCMSHARPESRQITLIDQLWYLVMYNTHVHIAHYYI